MAVIVPVALVAGVLVSGWLLTRKHPLGRCHMCGCDLPPDQVECADCFDARQW